MDDLLHLIMIDVPYQEKRFGSALLTNVEQIMFNEYSVIRLQTFEDNVTAIRFYEDNGWAVEKKESVEGLGIKMLHMMKRRPNHDPWCFALQRRYYMTDKPGRARHFLFALFALYVLIMLLFLVVPNNYRMRSVFVGGLTRERWLDYVVRNFNLIPLRGIAEQIGNIINGQHLARNIIYLTGNIIGFIPLGIFLPTLFFQQRRFLPFLVTVLASIAVLALIQVLTMRGSFDIDDIILNATGACLGFGILRHRLRRTTGLSTRKRT